MPKYTTKTKPTTIERNGFVNFSELGNMLIGDLVDMGFDVVYPDPISGVNANTHLATLRPRAPTSNTFTPDPLSSNPAQTWHINIDCSTLATDDDPGCLRICVTHPIQAPNNGSVSEEMSFENPASSGNRYYSRKSGELTSGWFAKDAKIPGNSIASDQGIVTIPFASRFWNGKNPLTVALPEDVGSTAYSYRLTVSFQGIALVVWQEGQDLYGDRFSWVVIQRPVSPANGAILSTGKCPVFCLYSIGGGEPNNIQTPNGTQDAKNPYVRTHAQYDNNAAIYWFTVREIDVYKPTIPVLATVDSPDSRVVINAKQQVSITEGNKYVISFPNGFNTDRYMYREELDLITYTSADVISQYSNVAVSIYNEQNSRQYKAMHANLPNNAGMRILILTYGPGFDVPV